MSARVTRRSADATRERILAAAARPLLRALLRRCDDARDRGASRGHAAACSTTTSVRRTSSGAPRSTRLFATAQPSASASAPRDCEASTNSRRRSCSLASSCTSRPATRSCTGSSLQESKTDGPRMDWLVDRHVRPLYDATTEQFARLSEQGRLPPIAPAHLYYILTGAAPTMFVLAPECRRLSAASTRSPTTSSRRTPTLSSRFSSARDHQGRINATRHRARLPRHRSSRPRLAALVLRRGDRPDPGRAGYGGSLTFRNDRKAQRVIVAARSGERRGLRRLRGERRRRVRSRRRTAARRRLRDDRRSTATICEHVRVSRLARTTAPWGVPVEIVRGPRGGEHAVRIPADARRVPHRWRRLRSRRVRDDGVRRVAPLPRRRTRPRSVRLARDGDRAGHRARGALLPLQRAAPHDRAREGAVRSAAEAASHDVRDQRARRRRRRVRSGVGDRARRSRTASAATTTTACSASTSRARPASRSRSVTAPRSSPTTGTATAATTASARGVTSRCARV